MPPHKQLQLSQSLKVQQQRKQQKITSKVGSQIPSSLPVKKDQRLTSSNKTQEEEEEKIIGEDEPLLKDTKKGSSFPTSNDSIV